MAENAFRAGQAYDVQISFANVTRSQQKGTPGIQLTFLHEDGQSMIDHTIYITEKTAPFVEKALLKCFDLPVGTLSSPNFWKNIGNELSGKFCNITIVEEPYNGKMYKKVQYMNPPGQDFSDMPEPAAEIAHMFGGPAAPIPTPAQRAVEEVNKALPAPVVPDFDTASDDDLPF